jgi:hypothetical protein
VPRIKLTKSAIDALSTTTSDVVYWDSGCPGFGIKVTPKGRKVFLVLYRTGGAGSKLRKYTIGPFGKVTLHQARLAAQKVFTAKLEGRDPAREKREKLNREINAALADSAMRARIADMGVSTLGGSPADFGRLIADETVKWAKVIRSAGIKAS